jgi:hypothetical protein
VDEYELLRDTLRKTMAGSTGAALDAALVELGWLDMLDDPVAVAAVFHLFGESGAQASVLNDVVLHAAGRPAGGTVALPYAGGAWVVWERTDGPSSTVDDIRLHTAAAEDVPLAQGRRALAHWLVGSAEAMLALARTHVLDRVQFGQPLASFQAVRHRLAETLVAVEGAKATLAATDDEFGCLLAKAAAGQAALTAARNCQQVLGGMGFTAEHAFHRHFRRALLLDGLLGSARELTREAGSVVRHNNPAPRLVNL